MVNYHCKSYKLYNRDELIGIITNVSTDQPWFMGDIEVTPAFERFRAEFARLNDEDNDDCDSSEIDEQHWFIEDDDGVREEVLLNIEDGKDIFWRW